MALFSTISDSQNFNFCNFSGHFSCLSGQGEILTFSPWIEILRTTKYPLNSPVFFQPQPPVRRPPSHRTYSLNFPPDIQSFSPFQGTATAKSFSSKKSFVFSINRCLSGIKTLPVRRVSGASLGGLLGMDWGRFSSKQSHLPGENLRDRPG